ncbi:MAG: hypothetical protein AABZ14_02920, partial [Candidatus Margulisiibacteriota bacterium]
AIHRMTQKTQTQRLQLIALEKEVYWAMTSEISSLLTDSRFRVTPVPPDRYQIQVNDNTLLQELVILRKN